MMEIDDIKLDKENNLNNLDMMVDLVDNYNVDNGSASDDEREADK